MMSQKQLNFQQIQFF